MLSCQCVWSWNGEVHLVGLMRVVINIEWQIKFTFGWSEQFWTPQEHSLVWKGMLTLENPSWHLPMFSDHHILMQPLVAKKHGLNLYQLVYLSTRGVHFLLYFAYTCVRDLFIGGLFTYLDMQRNAKNLKSSQNMQCHYANQHKKWAQS